MGASSATRELARFLLTRGVWLVLLELTVIRASWTFNLDYAEFTLAGFGAIMVRDPADRRRLCLRIGLSATALYVVFAVLFMFLAPAGEGIPKIFGALNPAKYPASQPFLLMTLGPTIALLPWLERARGWIADVLATFGRVPMFYYLLHVPLIHVTALVVNFLREGHIHTEWYVTVPFTSVPPESTWALPVLYLVFVIVVVILYVPCRWFAGVRARRREAWLSYL